MKSKFRVTILVIGLTIFSYHSFCQDLTKGSDLLIVLLKNAGAGNKKLFLMFGWEGCKWCRVFDQYHHDRKVKAILDRYYMIVNLDIYKSKAGEALYKVYGKQGTPSWTIFDSNRMVLADCDNGKGNIGYPVTEDELAYYISVIRKTTPGISQVKYDKLITKLKEYKEKK